MVELQGIRKSYGGTNALKPVSLKIKRGSCFGFIGPNGAGKSTLMKIIVGIIQADEGTVSLHEGKVHHWKNTIGYIPQEVCLEEMITAKQQLEFYGDIHQLAKKERDVRVEEVLRQIGLEARMHDKIATFSSGMKRRLHIGCALLHQPKVILMDEPTVGIDPQSRHAIYELIQQLKDQQCTILYSSHYIEEVERICDEVAFMDEGEIVMTDHVQQLIKNYTMPQIYVKWQDAPPASILQHIQEAKPHEQGVLIETNEATQVEHLQSIIHHTFQSGAVLEHLSFTKNSLEDIFFTYTGTILREEGEVNKDESYV